MTWNGFVQTNLSCSVIIYSSANKTQIFDCGPTTASPTLRRWSRIFLYIFFNDIFFFFFPLSAPRCLPPTQTSSSALNKDKYSPSPVGCWTETQGRSPSLKAFLFFSFFFFFIANSPFLPVESLIFWEG